MQKATRIGNRPSNSLHENLRLVTPLSGKIIVELMRGVYFWHHWQGSEKADLTARKEHKEKGVIATASAAWREAIQKTISRGGAEKIVFTAKNAKSTKKLLVFRVLCG